MGMADGLKVQWTILENSLAVSHETCSQILLASEQAIAERGEFQLVLTGGRTAENVYKLLAKIDTDWSSWHLWYGDERCLPKNHCDRNSLMIEKSLLSRVDIPADQVHVIPAELGAAAAAKHYANLLDGFQLFDMVLLGLGEDGHIASLFPGHRHSSGDAVLPVYGAPKLPAERVSLSAERLSRCRSMVFIITGEQKSQAVSRWRQGEDLPANTVRGIEKTEALIDTDAWAES